MGGRFEMTANARTALARISDYLDPQQNGGRFRRSSWENNFRHNGGRDLPRMSWILIPLTGFPSTILYPCLRTPEYRPDSFSFFRDSDSNEYRLSSVVLPVRPILRILVKQKRSQRLELELDLEIHAPARVVRVSLSSAEFLAQPHVIEHSDLLFIARRPWQRFQLILTTFSTRVNTDLFGNQTVHTQNGTVRFLVPATESPYYPTCLLAGTAEYKTQEIPHPLQFFSPPLNHLLSC